MMSFELEEMVVANAVRAQQVEADNKKLRYLNGEMKGQLEMDVALIKELRELNAELLEELSNLSDTARLVMLEANNHGAGYDIDGMLESAEIAIVKAEKLK